MGFKEDADFARFVSMGAAGTAAVGRFLRDAHGHRPIELERYSMANKVWQTKVKRLRLPDLVCVRCGRRIEARAKSKLGVILSHSDREGRQWNAGGMRPRDLYAFARADLSVVPPTVGRPIFFAAGDLGDAADKAKLSDPKAASEGSEVTITWPAWVPDRDGVLTGVADDRIVVEWSDGRRSGYWQWKRWGVPRYLYLSPGDPVIGSETIVAGVVAPVDDLQCVGDTWNIEAALRDPDATERYAAIKAVGVLGLEGLIPAVAEHAEREDDWRLRLEACASLSRLDPPAWTPRIVDVAEDPEASPETRMEAVFALSEIPTDEAAIALRDIADEASHPFELRSAAVWGIGRGARRRGDLLSTFMADPDPVVALHAIVALESMPPSLIPELQAWLASGNVRKAAAARHVLVRHQQVHALLEAAAKGDEGRPWALAALGDLDPELVAEAAGATLDASLRELWGWHGLTDIHQVGRDPRKDVQNGDRGEEQAPSPPVVHAGVQVRDRSALPGR